MNNRESELMAAVAGGDRNAFKRLYDLYHRALFNYFYKQSRSREVAEDLTQELFLRLWKAAPTYRPTATFVTFVFTIAHNLFLNEASKMRPRTMETIEAPLRDENVRQRELRETIAAALADLPPAEREVFVMSEYGGLKYREIADLLDIPEGTVKSRMFEACRRLREKLKPYMNR